MRVPSTMAGGHKFSQVPRATIERSQFNRSFGHKTTFDAGLLVPVLLDEILPGDTFNVRMAAFARLATPLKPLMDNMVMDTFFFFVPTRLVWDNWAKFNGEQTDPGDSTDFSVPRINVAASGAYGPGGLHAYFGIPQVVAGVSGFWHSALPGRCYNLIWNEWFRDENIQDSVTVPTDDGPDNGNLYAVLRRGKRHDYFTSCLPWPQKGDSVSLPLGTTAPIVGTGDLKPSFSSDWGFGNYAGVGYLGETPTADANKPVFRNAADGTLTGVAAQRVKWLDPKLQVDLSGATAATINELRQAFQIQKLLERDARGGTRYTEIVRSHFGVTSPDARLQRPEYLGGGSSPVIISPIAQTSEDGTTPQGNLAAIGTVSAQGHGFVKSFTEHGFVIGLVCVRADLTYQQGLERFWHRETRYDFYWPALSHIGEQAVLNDEIYLQGAGADASVFGYQERYAEYRYKPSIVSGLFSSITPSGSLDIWHLAQEFTALPTLSPTFIVEDPPIDRVIATPTEPHFLFDSFFKMVCARPMPVYGVPGLIDHF